jgi:hypothetical protein
MFSHLISIKSSTLGYYKTCGTCLAAKYNNFVKDPNLERLTLALEQQKAPGVEATMPIVGARYPKMADSLEHVNKLLEAYP